MRMIGTLNNETHARLFSDYLYVQGIENNVEPGKDGSWAVWVRSEDHLAESERLLGLFLEDPDRPEYRQLTRYAKGMRKEEAKEDQRSRARVIDVRTQTYRESMQSFTPVTIALIVISVAVAVMSRLGEAPERLNLFFITQIFFEEDGISWIGKLPEILHGEVWRLFTPMFLHFGIMHLLFNMLWLKDLGTMIERRKGALFLALLVLAISAASNVSQYLVSGPFFGGMSGVVYGLLGYAWMKGKFDPASGLALHPNTVVMMVVWFFLCLTGWLGPIANTAHGVGLGLGMLWGFLSSGRSRFRRRSD